MSASVAVLFNGATVEHLVRRARERGLSLAEGHALAWILERGALVAPPRGEPSDARGPARGGALSGA